MKRLRLAALLMLGVWSASFLRAAEAPRIRFLRGVQDLEQRRYADAFADLDALRRMDPADARVNYYLGRAYYETGNREMAARYFLYATRLDPGLTAAHLYLGKIALELRRLKAARYEIGLALRLDGGMAEAHYWMGRCLEALQRPRQAAWEYRTAYRLAPGLSRAKKAWKRLEHLKEKRRRVP